MNGFRQLLIVLAVFGATAVFAASGVEEVQIGRIKVYPYMEAAPRIKPLASFYHPGKTDLVNKKWLVIQVEFTPGVDNPASVRRSGGSPSPKPRSGMWIDDVKMEVRVLYPLVAKLTGEKRKFGVFTGSVTFWSLPVDGRTHSYAVMVPPQLLDRYLPLRSLTGKSSEMAATKTDFVVEVGFFDRNGGELGYGYGNFNLNPKLGADYHEVFDKYCAKAPKSSVIPDSVWGKERTPWGVLDFETYDLVRPAEGAAKGK